MLITSPDMERRVRKMERADIGVIVRRTALRAAREYRPLLAAEARRRGGRALGAAVQVHDGHQSTLVMLQRGDPQDVLVGVAGDHALADEATEHESGGLETPASGWLSVHARTHRRSVHASWSGHLTAELSKVWR